MVFLFFLFAICDLLLAIFSYGFIDTNFPLIPSKTLFNLVHYQRPATTAIYIILLIFFFLLYIYLLRKIISKKISSRQVWMLIFINVGILLFSFPALSYDIFNYLATAKVTFFYRENPYLVMPIEFTGEPMLRFMHAANKYALYGPFWILLTVFPHLLGAGNLFLTIFSFKLFVIFFYLGSSWLIWQISKKSAYSLAFFALNPLVLIETLNSAHNDVVMMGFALLAFYWLFQNKKVLAFVPLLASVGIKYATIVLLPVLVFFSSLSKEKLLLICTWVMFLVFLLSPLREEIYPWYFIWVISFAALIPQNKFWRWLVFGFSLGLLLRYTPFLFFRHYNPPVPLLKSIMTFVPAGIVLLFGLTKKRYRIK